jgi:lipopolysaccharide transport system ATP-binding protein
MMSNVALRMDRVYKKFSRGERHDSLRDLIPALARQTMRRARGPLELKEEEFWAIDDVSFEVGKGEALGVIGHNGAGKSTILKHLNGIMRPTSGSVEVHGRLSALIEIGAGFHPDLTGRENVFLNGVILGMSRSEIRRKFDEIVDFAGLRSFIDTPVKRYSSGMHARLGFSVAAHMEPDILVIDEVLSVGDYAFRERGIQKMRSVLMNGTTVVFVSHNLHAVVDLCPRCLLLDHGRLIADGSTRDVVQTYMEQIGTRRVRTQRADTEIESVVIRNAQGPTLEFKSGETIWVDLKLRALRPTDHLSCVLFLRDGSFHQIFNISTDRLGQGLIHLDSGDEREFSFELTLHLATGTFHIGVLLHRHDTNQWFENMDPAASISVTSQNQVGLAVNLYPKIVEPGKQATQTRAVTGT